MKTPTRIHKGNRQILFEGVWCDVPHGYRAGDEVNAKAKAVNRAVRSAKEILGDAEDSPVWFDLKDPSGMDNNIWVDEWAEVIARDVDTEILNALIGTFEGFRIHHSPALPLTGKQNDE